MERLQRATVRHAVQLMASRGACDPTDPDTGMLRKKVSPTEIRSYAEPYEWLAPGQLLDHPPASWRADWAAGGSGLLPPGRTGTIGPVSEIERRHPGIDTREPGLSHALAPGGDSGEFAVHQ